MSTVDTIVLVCPLALWRDCVGRVLAAEFSNVPILAFSDLREWYAVSDWHGQSPLLVIFEIGQSVTLDDLRVIISRKPNIGIAIISDNSNPSRIIEAINIGVRAYIPNDQSIEIALKAIQLVIVGGSFLPISSLRQDVPVHKPVMITSKAKYKFNISRRQFEIIAGVSRGKSNADIAQDLNIKEATIKVHIRNIMKKMGVNTRTAIAYKSKEMLQSSFFPKISDGRNDMMERRKY